MYNKFELQGHLGNPDRKLLRRAHELDPDNIMIINSMLEYTKDKKELKRIGEIIKKIVKKEPKNIDNLEVLAEYYSRMKKTKKEISEICNKTAVPWIYKSCYDKDCRSSPNSFHGIGIDQGLKILSEPKHSLSNYWLNIFHSLF